MPYVPNFRWLTDTMGVRQERVLQSSSRVAVPAPLLRRMFQALAEAAPFSEAFYLATYEDVREAHQRGEIPDPRRHFVETGYFEGRVGAKPEIDEAFYRRTYPDVEAAIRGKHVSCATEHYLRSGVYEGRMPSAAMQQHMEVWRQAAKSA